jgi:hypothetical protein
MFCAAVPVCPASSTPGANTIETAPWPIASGSSNDDIEHDATDI